MYDPLVFQPPAGVNKSVTPLIGTRKNTKHRPFILVKKGKVENARPQVPGKLETVGKDYVTQEEHNAIRGMRDAIPLFIRIEMGQTAFVDWWPYGTNWRPALDSRFDSLWQECGNTWVSHKHNSGPTTQQLVMFRNGPAKSFGHPVFKCAEPDCDRRTAFIRQQEHPFAWYCVKVCRIHLKDRNRRITLGRVYKAGLPPELVKHVSEIIADPDGMAASEELAMAKALMAKLLAHLSATDGGFTPESTAISLKALDKVTAIAERQAKIAEKQENRLAYKQVLVLLSAAVERVLMLLGKTDDAKVVLYTILPDLPWPAGVAKVHGTEGLIGRKGELILPAKPQEKKLTIDADFEGMDTNYEEEREKEIKVLTKQELEDLMIEPVEPSKFEGHRLAVPRLQRGECPPDCFMAYDEIEAPPGVPPEQFRPPDPISNTHDII